ncbi:hypothetical protein AGMMS49545_23850 [Betaproteobacteria bacterium]|nr:hypothetical protein AGMMS49545_23850 [Betaproteobacteria bacterium]GHU49331.1 hypothetical protein AGMMS50289_26370 [Betaproteobacteria bacterium]
MKYFILSRKKERGCPTGFLFSVLYDRFYPREEAKKIEHGYFPWYKDMHIPNAQISLPDGLCLIAKEPLYDFEIRGVGSKGNIYYASEDFFALLKKHNIPLRSSASISVCSQDGKRITEKDYFVVILETVEIFNAVDMENSILKMDDLGFITRIKKLAIKNGAPKDFFKIHKIDVNRYNTAMCSELFRDEMLTGC